MDHLVEVHLVDLQVEEHLVEVHLVEAHLVDLHMWCRRRQSRGGGVAWPSVSITAKVMYSLPVAGHVGDLWVTLGIQFLPRTRKDEWPVQR